MITPLVLRAIELAAIAHHGQLRKYHPLPTPYVVHPIRCVKRLLDYRPTHNRQWHSDDGTPRGPLFEDMAVVLALHDVLEDCHFPNEVMIRDEFGPLVADGVRALTNPSKGSMAPRDERKAIDRHHIARAAPCWQFCKLIDSLDNIEDMTGCVTPYGIHWDGKLQLVKFAHERYIPETRLLVPCLRGADGTLADKVIAACDALQAKCEPFIVRCD